MRAWRSIEMAAAAVLAALAGTAVLYGVTPDRAITLLVYLPGIVIVEALFGFWAGLATVLLSVAGSASYRIMFLPHYLQLGPYAIYQSWEEEIILLLVGLLVVVLTEQWRQSGRRAVSVEKQLAAVLENVSDAVIVFGRDLRVRSMNRAALTMLNRPGETVVGEDAESLRRRFQFERPGGTAGPETLAEVCARGQALHEQGVILDVSQQRRIEVMIHTLPWCDHGRRVDGVVSVIADLTAIKALQMRLLDSARQAAAGQMFSGLSHDFNHSLDIIRRSLAVLEMHENAPAAERRRYREMIDRAAIEGSQIVRRLRDYLAGGPGEPAPVDLAEVARDALALTHPLWRSRSGLELRSELGAVPLVSGNRSDLQRLVVNLLFNAIEAIGAQPGRITLHTGADAEHVRVWVEDNGPGITPAQRERLFQPYYTTKPNGLGLGLFSAAQIAALHGGRLRVESQPGERTRFTLELPRPRAASLPQSGSHPHAA
ncbi:MAG TPA: ATP-binding protein [Terriglobales bacterium]|nr:ATP-binding protein [Terriglobales bacterium]